MKVIEGQILLKISNDAKGQIMPVKSCKKDNLRSSKQIKVIQGQIFLNMSNDTKGQIMSKRSINRTKIIQGQIVLNGSIEVKQIQPRSKRSHNEMEVKLD
jgi:hypothetical protein